ncbi:MAG TPA: biotin--[acetyl-CoA-carboxylase] ligase [Clostridiales bacterium]|nr:biotin--[acetyl-CoA-carboxylase] ligase [Clostridiales bacterium]
MTQQTQQPQPQPEDIRIRILTLLENQSGKFLSGEQIGKILGVSRNAVWKHINHLKKYGYEIQSVSNKGYCMTPQEAVYNGHEIAKRLKRPAEVHFMDNVDSTNNVAKQMMHQGCGPGNVVVALEQTAGKGRLGRQWNSSGGKGVWLSYCLRPTFSIEKIGLVTLAGACAVCELLIEQGFDAGIKWPNDILIHGKKVCGILTETVFEETRIDFVVVGVGLNMSQTKEDFGPDLENSATSLRIESGKNVNMSVMAAALIDQLQLYFSYLEKGETKKIIDCWKSYSITLGRTILTTINGKKEPVMALDIRQDGALTVRKQDGTITDIISGEILLD